MAYYKCPNCKKVFSVDILVDPAPVSPSNYPPMPCPRCGHLSHGASVLEVVVGKISKVFPVI